MKVSIIYIVKLSLISKNHHVHRKTNKCYHK